MKVLRLQSVFISPISRPHMIFSKTFMGTDEDLSDAEELPMPQVILGSAEWSTKQRMLSPFWNAAQPSIHTTMTVNYPWLTQCGAY